jgi:hypothetical protein
LPISESESTDDSMITTLDTRIISSFLLWIDHQIQSNGQAFTNVPMRFYPTTSPYSGYGTYTTQYKPICNDTAVSGANILSGVYLNGNYVSVGQSGLKAINHYKGALYFSGQLPPSTVISGNGALKEINVKLTDKTDWHILFETQYVPNGTNPVPPTTGLKIDSENTPILFLRVKGQENRPFGFAKLDNQTIYMRAILIADNEFQKIGVTSLLKNLNLTSFPIVTSTPFDSLGNMTGLNYNYDTVPKDLSVTPIVLSVKVIDVPQQGDYKSIIRNMAMADFEISTVARS